MTNPAYVWAFELSEKNTKTGDIGEIPQVVITPKTVKSYFPLADANGNCVTYLDEAGNVQAHYTYDAFGGMVSSDGDMDDDFRFQFSSKYLDDETGLYYYGYRYFSTVLGRWINSDPIGEAGYLFFALPRGLKSYSSQIQAYASRNLTIGLRNNALYYIDPLGLKCSTTLLYGHGGVAGEDGFWDYDGEPTWGYIEALSLFPQLDETDRLAPFMCYAGLLSQYIFETLEEEADPFPMTDDDAIDLMMDLNTLIIPSFDWVTRTPTGRNEFMELWHSRIKDVKNEAENAQCKNDCCTDVYLTVKCDNDPAMQRNADKLSRIIDLPGLPEGENFCGKVWRYNCDADYWAYEGESKPN